MNDQSKTVHESIEEESKTNFLERLNFRSLVNNDNKRKINTITSSKKSNHYISNLINDGDQQLPLSPQFNDYNNNINE
jgi:hypothetical protein